MSSKFIVLSYNISKLGHFLAQCMYSDVMVLCPWLCYVMELSSDVMLCWQSTFVRHNTPHPKELRSRYSKLMHRNDIDGHVITHDPQHDKVTSTHHRHHYSACTISALLRLLPIVSTTQ